MTHNSSHQEHLIKIEAAKSVTELTSYAKEPNEELSAIQRRWSQLLTQPVLSESDFLERLAQVKRAYKQGRFDTALGDAARNLTRYLRSLGEVKEEPAYYKARTLLYELNDILSIDPEISDWTFDDGERAYTQLQDLETRWSIQPELTNFQRKLLKEKVLFCACYGHGLKRRNEPQRAREIFRSLLDFTNKLKTDEMPWYGTRANLSYHLGSVYRVLEEHQPSEDMYTEALKFYHARSKTRPENDLDDFYFTTRRIAMCIGLGFGWLHLTRGNLKRSEHALITARAFLAKSPDTIISSFLELLYGSLRRCTDGRDQTEAINSLTKARDAFENRHPRYHAYACLDLALSFTLTQNFDEALSLLALVEEYAREQQNEHKWLTNIHIRRSRIRRQLFEYEQALSEAENAIAAAERSEPILPRADAYIAHGEAQFYYAADCLNPATPGYNEARKDFETALQLLTIEKDSHNHQITLNPKIASVCELRIAQCYARVGNQIEAKSHFEKWRTFEPVVEHQWIRDLASTVEVEISKLKESFNIPSSDSKQWNYDEQIDRLRKWLYSRAMEEAGNNKSRAAKLVGVSSTALSQWMNGADRKSKKQTK